MPGIPSYRSWFSLSYLSKCWFSARLTILPESSSEGTDSPIIFSSTLRHLATTHFIILNWVCIDFTCTFVCGPVSFLSSSGKGCKPFTFSPLSRFFNCVWCLVTPQSQYSTRLHICGLICSEATCNFLTHVWCLCNTHTSNLCKGTHLLPLMA